MALRHAERALAAAVEPAPAARVGLRAIRARTAGRGSEVRARNAAWLRQWEATRPPEDDGPTR